VRGTGADRLVLAWKARFDRFCHQRSMAKLAQRVGDRRLLVLIGRLLKAKVVLPDGVVIGNEQGVPQTSYVMQPQCAR
jgi:retron-type reverse transcriptase